jgi:hypothetical protein
MPNKIKAVNGDIFDLVTLIHKESDGMCVVKEHPPSEGTQCYRLHKSMLQTPAFLKPRARRVPYVDPYVKMCQLAATKY